MKISIFIMVIFFSKITFAQTTLSASYSVESSKGKLILKQGGSDIKVISELPQDTLPVKVGEYVYYSHNELKDNKIIGIPMRYSIKEHKSVSLLESLTAKKLPVGKIVVMMTDESRNRLYYTLETRKEQGVPIYTTLMYRSGDDEHIEEYIDGLIENIDKDGSIAMVYYDVDPEGPYLFRSIHSADGVIIKTLEKVHIEKKK